MLARLAWVCFAGCAAVLAGCQSYYFTDSVDLTLDFSPLVGPSDSLHSPYVTGAQVTVYAQSSDSDADESAWTIESADPSVVRVDTTAGGRANVVAVGPGTTSLRLRDGADVVHSEQVEVRAPVAAELLWHGELLLGHDEAAARVDDATILDGGTATFLVRWVDADGRRLSGNGALRVEAQSEISANVVRSFLFEDRDWLRLTPRSVGPHGVAIFAGDTAVGAFHVSAVGAGSVDHIVIEGQSEAGHSRGACLVMLAVARDSADDPIYGAEYTWDVDGEALRTYGDVLHYDFDPALPVTVGATFGDARSEATVHASGGYVASSSNAIGCSATGSNANSGLALLVPVALVGLWMSRRRRRR